MKLLYFILIVCILSCTERNPIVDNNGELSNLEIYFIASEDSITTNLYKIRGDGSDLTKLISFNKFFVGDLKISPDNTKFLIGNSAFAFRDSSYYYEYLFTSFQNLIWMPDGNEIIAVVYQGRNDLEIVKADLFGLNWQYLTENDVDDQNPVVSFTDDKIFYDSNGNIFQMNLDGSDQTVLIDTTQLLSNIKFNYDGSLFSYLFHDTLIYYWTTYIGNSTNPFLVNSDIQSDIHWSPVSNQIILSSYLGIQLFNYNNNSISTIKSRDEGFGFGHIEWSPDGNKIVYYFSDIFNINNYYSGGINIIDISSKQISEVIKTNQFEVVSGFCVLPKIIE